MFADVNGTTLYYTVSGNGPPVVLLHCNYASHKIFDVLTKQLEPDHTVYAIDSRGHGKSRRHAGYSYETMAEDIAALIDKLGIVKPALYGYSDGGILGLLLAAKHPGMLSVLMVSGANLDISGQKASALRLVKFGYCLTRDKRLRLILDQPAIPFSLLEQIEVPTLVLAGSKDMIQEAHTRKIAAHIKNSTLVILEGEGHGSYISHSKKLYPIIKPFLDAHLSGQHRCGGPA